MKLRLSFMLNGFRNKIDKLAAFDFQAELETIVAENTPVLDEMVIEQLASGTDGNEEPNTIDGNAGYRLSTIAIKRREGVGLGAITDYVTNYMTGAFYESIVFKEDGDLIEADSDVSYFGDIKLYSSDALLEVNEKNRRQFAETITLPAITLALKEKADINVR